MEGNVIISRKQYLRLKINSEKLYRLEVGGVDNWTWYDESLHPNDEPDMDTFEEEEKIRIDALETINKVP